MKDIQHVQQLTAAQGDGQSLDVLKRAHDQMLRMPDHSQLKSCCCFFLNHQTEHVAGARDEFSCSCA